MIEEFAGKVQENAKDKYGIDIVSIMSLVELILGVVDNCFQGNEQAFVQAAQQPTNLQRAMVNIRIRKDLGIRKRSERQAIANEIFGQCAAMSTEQLSGAYQEAMGVVDPETDFVDYDFSPSAAE